MTLQEIKEVAKAYGACKEQYKQFVKAMITNELKAWQIALGNVYWLQDYIRIDILELCRNADNIGRIWDSEGNLKHECNYQNGKKHGLCRWWYNDGNLYYEEIYKMGLKHGICREWYRNGALSYEYTYRNGKLHGLSRSWYNNGGLAHESNYKNGLKHGLSKWCREDGSLYFMNNFNNSVTIEANKC